MSRRGASLLLLGCLASAPAFAGVWSNLWRTPDQQGEALLAAGRPAQAAARFTSPQRKAYADLLAGRYAQAAQLLQPLKDPTSEYNLGNALAHLGRLRAALSAYDAALKLRPHDRDIRHNRDLVARMLAHQPPQHPSPQQGKSGSQSHPGNPGGTGHGTGAGQGSRQGGSHGGKRAANGKTAPDGNPQRAGTGRSGEHNGARAGAPSPAQTNPPSSTGSAAHNPGQTLRNAERAAALARAQQRNGSGSTTAGTVQQGPRSAEHALLTHGSQRPEPPKPPSEETLALKQWLRQIPNDPAGLLRRKFLIEYLLRHPGANP